MNKFEFPIPIPKGNIKASKSVGVLIQIITYFRILLTRINESKEIEAKYSGTGKFIPFNLETIVLDIKTLYLFAKIYIDYFISYISRVFLSNYNLKFRSFNDHVKCLKRNSFDDSWFKEYKEFILKFERRIKFRIKYIRDKMITHRDIYLNEYWGFDDQTKNFYIYFDKSIDPINIDIHIKNGIIKLGKKYNIDIFHDKKSISDFVYLDLILSNLENLVTQIEKDDENKIKQYRDKLGIIINEENLFQLIYDFSEGISEIFRKKYPNISTRYFSRF